MGFPTEFDWRPLLLSFQVATVASAITFVTATGAARLLWVRRVWGRDLWEAVFLLPLVLPPVVTGYLLLLLLGQHGGVGRFLEHSFGLRLLFTPAAAVLASATVAFPLMYQCAKAAFSSIDPILEDAARSLGAPAGRAFWTVIVPLAWPGLLAGAVLSLARAAGEFGATMMVAGNIVGRTTTTPTAIYMAAEGGDLRTAGIYAAIMGAFNLVLVMLVNFRARGLRR